MKALAVVMFASALVSPLKAQDTTRVVADSTDSPVTPLYRNPRTAQILGSIIPGAGHIYAGEGLEGFRNYEATVTAIGGGVLAFNWDPCMFNFLSTTRCSPGPQWPHQALGVALVGLGIWKWISSARDAPHAAERTNAKHLRHKATANPVIEPPVDVRSGWRVGTKIHF